MWRHVCIQGQGQGQVWESSSSYWAPGGAFPLHKANLPPAAGPRVCSHLGRSGPGLHTYESHGPAREKDDNLTVGREGDWRVKSAGTDSGHNL